MTYYFRLDDIELDLFLNIQQSKNESTTIDVQDTYFPATNPAKKRQAYRSDIRIYLGTQDTSLTSEGILPQSSLAIYLKVFVYMIMGAIILIPDTSSSKKGVILRTFGLYWISIEFITQTVIEQLGENTPWTNSVMIYLTPTIMAYILASTICSKRFDTKQNSRLLTYVTATICWLIFCIFAISNGWKNSKTVSAIVYAFIIPLVLRFCLICFTDGSLKQVNLHFVVSIFLIIRTIQIIETTAGMIHRSFVSCLLGNYLSEVTVYYNLLFISILYEIAFCKYTFAAENRFLMNGRNETDDIEIKTDSSLHV